MPPKTTGQPTSPAGEPQDRPGDHSVCNGRAASNADHRQSAFSSFVQIANWLGGLPRIARLTLRRELIATIPLAVIIGVLGSLFCGFVGRKALGMPDYLLAGLIACSMTGLLTAGLSIGFVNQRRKIKTFRRVLIAASVILITISLTPAGRLGQYIFLLQVLLAQVCVALLATLRTSIWRANYPTGQRGKIVVVIQLCLMLVSSGVIFLFTKLMDELAVPFQSLYVVSGLCGLLGAHLFSRIRIRHERQTLRNLAKRPGSRARLFAGMAVLGTDKLFRKYMSWQMLNGLATLVVETVLVIIIADVFEGGWLLGGSVLTAIPMLTTGLAGLAWARIFDRMDIFNIRVRTSLCWAISRFVLMLGVWQNDITIVMISRVLSGLAGGGGQLAWRLGHMHFAPPEKDSLYMGAHISLTGLRGIVAPFLGIYLYRLDFLGPNGIWLIGISGLCQVISALGFRRMAIQQNA